LEVIMAILSGRHWNRAVSAAASLGLVAATFVFSTPASAQPVGAQADISCNTPVTSAPSGPATVSAASTPYGRVLVVGSGDEAGCSLYLLTSDRLHEMTSGAVQFACSDGANVLGKPCDTVLWPALLTEGTPIAGPGVNPNMLGTVTRTDLPGLPSVEQVTYAGLPLYRFFLDETPGETEGANLFDPVTSPAGTWYLVDPARGRPAVGTAHLQVESVGGTEVLAATMNNDFSVFPNASFPVYTLSTDRRHTGVCRGLCALVWQPVLTSGRPVAGPGVDQKALGIIVRHDGTHQVTYNRRPLYLFVEDAYIKGVTGTQSINGAGLTTAWGVFDTIPLAP
jgi:predicted lipoprotein with Yx(FWY)xxD motif